MARLPRLVLPGQPHLVLQRTLDHRPAFVDDEDRAQFMVVLRTALETEAVQLHAFALRDHELLFLVTPAQPDALARLMQAIGRRYVTAYNRRHARSGPLWDGRFRTSAVEPGEHTLTAMTWIEQATLTPGITSAPHHAGTQPNPLITDPPEYWQLGNTPFERESAWRERLARGVAGTTEARLRRLVLGGWALGSPEFICSADATGRPAAPRRPGRPKRAASNPR